MAWQERTEAGRQRCILIDAENQDWVISDGRLQWDSTGVSQVYHAVMTAIGSIPTSPLYGSRVHDPWKVNVSMPGELEDSLIASLEPLVKANVVQAGTIVIEIEPYRGEIGIVTIRYKDGGGQSRRLVVPMQPGIRD